MFNIVGSYENFLRFFVVKIFFIIGIIKFFNVHTLLSGRALVTVSILFIISPALCEKIRG